MSAQEELIAIAYAPDSEEAFNSWLNADDAYSFLKHNAKSDDIVVYSTISPAFINSVWLPNAVLKRATPRDLQTWNFNAYTSWGATTSFKPKKTFLSAPLHGEGPIYSKAEPFIFASSFSGRLDDKHYHEVLQKFAQISGVYFLEERASYCRIDEKGDVEEAIRIRRIPPKNIQDFGGIVITCKRDLIERYAELSRSTLIRLFDFTRYRPGQFTSWGQGSTTSLDDGEIHARRTLEPGYGSFTRGYQIVRNQSTRRKSLSVFDPSHKVKRKYASFIIHDWRNKAIVEVSTAPMSSCNYFNCNEFPNHPFEVSPAFFRSDVLAKYKADTTKYSYDSHNISCRETWYLRGLGVNEAGQIHTYLCYLRNLPYEEQIYWRSFNEAPKGGLSKASYAADFLGSWDSEYDTLRSLKEWVWEQPRKGNLWWTIKDEQLLEKVHYPLTNSFDEWANEILLLDQLLVEGLNKTPLQEKLVNQKKAVDNALGPIKLARECLTAGGSNSQSAEEAIAPLSQLHYLRTKVKGHANSSESKAALQKEFIAKHGSLTAHFKAICTELDRSLRDIAERLNA